MIAVDTNLLVYAHRSGCPEHREAIKAIEKAAASPAGWGFCLPSVSEFWMVVTHPSCEGGPSTPEQATAFLRALVDTGKPIICAPRSNFSAKLIMAARDLGVTGVRIFDLQIGLMAIAAGATEIWTHDAGFARIPGIKISDPLD
jgi:toxin-antitoxin system PIN domain toxin